MHSQQNSAPARPRQRALVLGGGGAAGNAWEIGVIAGLFDAGLDVTAADVVVGTSAGSTVAAQITSGRTPTELLADILAEPRPDPLPAPAPRRTRGEEFMAASGALIAAATDAADMRRRMGTAAVERAEAADGAWQARWRATVASRLPSRQWPDRRVLIVAVDADTGEPAVLQRGGGVDLVDAVAASCSSSMAYAIGERRYIDGGYRRNENADLAAGCAAVLVLSPFSGRTRHPLSWAMQLSAQVEELRAGGSRVETVVPDGAVRDLFDVNALDVSRRLPAALAGRDQGRALAGQLADLWL